ncbi:hypothetical protein [Parapedobacter pyrenivorans]|uniref:hypothetical protein n=1 Tax=Parapedobacter pyrenivorans TaxID=1305674 RepID=UPI00333E270F
MKNKRAKTKLYLLFFYTLIFLGTLEVASARDTSNRVRIEWKDGQPSGNITVYNGDFEKLTIEKGRGRIEGSEYRFSSVGNNALHIEVANAAYNSGPEATIITIADKTNAFSFFLRDVTKEYPIFLPDYGVVVLRADDHRSYATVETDVLSRKSKTKIQQLSDSPEETSFASVEHRVRDMSVPTWLGVSRDFRIFQITEALSDLSPGEANIISPRRSVTAVTLPETENRPVDYLYTVGRGVGVQDNISRRLDQGSLPILHSTLTDDDIQYHSTTFVAFEKSALVLGSQFGTDFLVADSHSGGHMFTEAQREQLKTRQEAALNPKEETVLYFRSEAINTGTVPRYAWFKAPRPGTGWHHQKDYTFDTTTGFSAYASGKVFCISRMNGNPLQNEEIAILLPPGEKAVFEFYVPHSPVDGERARTLASQSFDQRYAETKKFWQDKLQQAAKIRLPEQRIEEMIQAGLLHLDLITFGNDPLETLAPNIGVYSPIGTESSPIIQFYNSMGWQDVAKRTVTYFLDKQHENGFIQNFGGYMVETGAALWTMGEYFRYTADKEWARQSASKLLKSANYLIEWRNRNKKDELRGRGYGMIEGKVADPEDHFHQFMLNGYAYIGLSRVAEVLAAIGHPEADRIGKEADAWKSDIRESFFHVMALSPVVPLGDGTWCPTVPPWTETTGLRALYLKPETFWSHGTVTVSDAMLGPLYLVFCEVLDADETAAKMLLDYNSELFYQGNAAFSQPYYSRHNWMQAKLGMSKPFLETYYSTFAALADRETYTFWEHLYKLTPHKTHEEGWFLMETRWMLYMEDGNALDLFKTIPRAWMADGEEILLDGVWSYFGPLRVAAKSNVGKGVIEATVESIGNRKPDTVRIRLPHPDYKKPVRVIGGTYDEKTETVIVTSFTGKATVRLEF